MSETTRLPWQRAEGKIEPRHRDRLAAVYVRQSTAAQVADPALALSADGRRAAVASMPEHGSKGHLLTLTVYDVEARRPVVGPADLGVLGVGLVGALAFSPDGSAVAVALCRRGLADKEPMCEVQIWRVPAKK